MNYATIVLETDDDGVARLTLNRPERHNALSAAMCDELTDAAAALDAMPGLRAVVLTGAGASFCAGGDLAWMRAQFDAPRAARLAEARRLAHMLRALDGLDLPLIGRVNGAAYGGGVGLMAVCDLAVAAEDARFGLTETRLGLIPATISPYVVARIGTGAARATFLSARLFTAAEAQRIGLVARVAGAADLDAAVAEEVAACLKTAPGAVAAAKRLVRGLGPRIDEAVIEATIARLADVWETDEARAGVGAFLAKRSPPWAR